MKINFYATFRLIAGTKSILLDLPDNAPILDAVNEVVRRYPALRPHLLDESGNLSGHIHLFVNSKDVTYLPEGLQSALKPDDTLDLFPPVGGG